MTKTSYLTRFCGSALIVGAGLLSGCVSQSYILEREGRLEAEIREIEHFRSIDSPCADILERRLNEIYLPNPFRNSSR